MTLNQEQREEAAALITELHALLDDVGGNPDRWLEKRDRVAQVMERLDILLPPSVDPLPPHEV